MSPSSVARSWKRSSAHSPRRLGCGMLGAWWRLGIVVPGWSGFVVQVCGGYGRQAIRWRLKSRFLAIEPLGMTSFYLVGTAILLGNKKRGLEGPRSFSSTLSSVYHKVMG